MKREEETEEMVKGGMGGGKREMKEVEEDRKTKKHLVLAKERMTEGTAFYDRKSTIIT